MSLLQVLNFVGQGPLISVRRICLAFLREWEGEFRRHAGGTGGMDTGECSTIYFTSYIFSLLLRRCTEEQWHTGNIEIGVVIHRRVRIWYLCFTYTPVPTVS